MDTEKVVRKIPASLWGVVSEKLVDITLKSSNAGKMPSSLAKTILYYRQKDQLATEVGLQCLLEASMILDPEKAMSWLEELGLPEIVAMLKETQR